MSKKILVTEEQYDKLFDQSRGIYETMIPVSYNNPLTILMGKNDAINEGLIKTYPFKDMERYVRQYFNIPSHYFHPYDKNGVMCVAIDLDNDNFLIREVDRAMNLCGYIKSISTELDDKIRVHYEPKFQERETYNGNFFYHITHHMNYPKIKRIGLVPSHKNKLFKYDDRIYLFSSEVSKEDLENFAKQLAYSQDKAFKDGLYFILKIKNDGNFNVYKDPNFEGGYWTSDNIPPSYIIDDFDTIHVKMQL